MGEGEGGTFPVIFPVIFPHAEVWNNSECCQGDENLDAAGGER